MRRGGPEFEVQRLQLRLRDGGRRVGQQVGATRCFRKRNAVAQRLGISHNHNQTVNTEGNAAVRRRSILKRVKQEAELLIRLLLGEAKHREHFS